MMNSNALLRLIGAAGSEKVLIDTLVKDLGIKTFLENAESIVLSNKTKRAIEWLNNILVQKEDLLESISGLTEIPVKFLPHSKESAAELLIIAEHPELLDVDARQFFKLLCLKEVIKDFEEEQDYAAENDGQDMDYNQEP